MVSERIQRRIDAFLDEADLAASAGEWGVVTEKARAVLAIDADNGDALAFLKMAEANGAAAGSEPGSGSSVATVSLNEPAPAAASPRAGPLPASFAAGRYRPLRLLGQGARKRVFLAHDERLGRDVAFASIDAFNLGALDRERLAREARAMGRLGAHPNLVSIFDVGEDGGSIYLVQEYMPGGDVAGLLREQDGPLDLRRAIAIAMDVCRALEAIHKAGFVHRDLKPANVFLAADGQAKLGDLGLAADTDRSRLTQHGMLLGTVAYMAPEQALGGEVTPASDLYALGCFLYELVTGAPPFGGEATAVISQHLNTPPVAPSWHTEHCPPPLEALILSLLEKDPAKRPASATAALEALEPIDPDEKSTRHSDASPLARLARGVFVGRTKELERLRKAFDEAFAGRGGVVMLTGEPGIGKTRTAQELESYARMRGAQVLWGRTHETGGAPPFWPWVQVGRSYAGSTGATALRQEMSASGWELVRLFPELREMPGFSEPRQEDDPEHAQFRLFDAYSRFLASAANRNAVVVVLDDLHWADRPTLKLLQHLARDLSHMRALVLGTYRDTDLVRTHPLSETLAELNREGAFERVNLRGLARAEVRSYIAAAANATPSPSLVARIYEETEGNPFFLAEVVNLMTEEGTLTKESVSDIRLPEGVKEALGRRLDRLSKEANELLKVAAVAGREFAFETLQLVSGHDQETVLRLIEEGLGARVIEEREGAGRYWFTHALMQETLLEELSTTRRVRLHGQIGEALEQRYGQRAEEQAARLAGHFVESAALYREHAAKALRYSRLAGEEALGRLAWDEAVTHFTHALEQAEPAGGLEPLQEAELNEGLGRAYAAMGQHPREAFRALSQAFRTYADARESTRAGRVAEFASGNLIGSARLRGMLLEAIALQPGGSVARGSLEAALGYHLGVSGETDEAFRHLDAAFAIAGATGDRRLELTASRVRATVLDFNGHLGLPDHVRAAALADELGDLAASASAHTMAALGHLTHDLDLARALEHATKGRAAAERTGLSRLIVDAAWFEAHARLASGGPANREALERALGLAPLDPRIASTGFFFALVSGDDGEAAAALETLDRLDRELQGPARMVTFLLWGTVSHAAWWWATGSAESRQAAARLCAEYEAIPVRVLGNDRLIQSSRGLVAIASGDRARIAAWHDEQRAGESWRRGAFPAIEVVKGLADEALGRPGEALEHYDEAVELYRPSLFYWTGAACERARLLVELGRPGAAAAIDEVIAVTSRAGANRWRDRALALKLRLQGITSTGVRSSIVAVSESVQAERPDLSGHTAPDGTVTIMFTDIEGSTALNVALGDDRWMALLAEHNRLIRACLAEHRGFEVKTEGDAFMAAFRSARDALRCARAIQEAITGRQLAATTPSSQEAHGDSRASDPGPQSFPVRVRVGLHTGEPVRQGNDFFGTHVVLASRIAGQAKGGEVLVSGLLRELVASSGEFAFEARAPVALKGLAGDHTLHALLWQGAAAG